MPRAFLAFLALLLLAPATAGATPTDRQSVEAKLTTMRPGATTGSQMDMRFVDPANPDGKPYSVDKVVVQLAPGTRFDNAAVPQCGASDPELMAQGPAACPAASRVQSGRLVLDTGSPLGIPRLMGFRTFTFNADGGLVSVGEAEDFTFRGVVRTRIDGETVTVDYTDAPGFGGPDGQSAMTTMFTAGPPLAPHGRPFLRTPPSCPRGGSWINRYTFIYHDGVRQGETTSDPCLQGASRARDTKPPRIRVRGIPRRRCARRAFRVRVRIFDSSALRSARIRLDGRMLTRSKSKRFSRRVRMLRAGRHRITVSARDMPGNRSRRILHFVSCP